MLTRFDRGFEADLVGLAVMVAAFHSPAGKPGGKGVRIVIAAGLRRFLRDRQPAELAAADDQRRIQQPAGCQVGDQGGDRCIGFAGELPMVARDVDVPVPTALVLHAAAIDLHEPHAPLDQSAGP